MLGKGVGDGEQQEHMTFLARNNRTFRPTSRLIDVKIAACTLPAGGEGVEVHMREHVAA